MENRKLTKSNNRQLAGVCGGIADYFGWEATWVRIAWVVFTLCAGIGLILYIVLAFVMPKAPKKSYQERMQERLDEHRSGQQQ